MKKLAIVVIFVFLAGCLLYFVQRSMIYFPTRKRPVPSAFQAGDLQAVTLKTADGLELNAWYKKPLEKTNPLIVYFHGNAGHIGYRMPIARQFINAGFGVLLVEYRGYGGNPGKPTEQGLYLDADAAMAFLHSERINPKQIVVYGESLGTGVASKVALEYPVCSLILQTPFRSLTEVAAWHYPWIWFSLWDNFDTAARINKIHVPVLIAHGKQDNVVPYQHGLSLFQQANEPKVMLSYDRRDHTNLWDKDYYNAVIGFIKQHCAR